jgi:5-formyltetrahydrofolate cyclo-ligase
MIFSQKKALRAHMKDKRALLFREHPDAGEGIARLFFEVFTFPVQTVIGGYWPIGSELDSRPLLEALVKKGLRCVLPCVSGQTLVFRLWEPTSSLVESRVKTFEPSAASPCIVPSVLLIPLLAFDRKGDRLGYGKGHYDRYLQQQECLKIGIGFCEQEADKIPVEVHDKRLDYVLTEKALIACS